MTMHAAPTGTITIAKDVVGEEAPQEVFAFTSTVAGGEDFTLAHGGEEEFTVALDEEFEFTESDLSELDGWEFTGVTCDEDVYTVDGSTLTVTLTEQVTDVTCTFTNTYTAPEVVEEPLFVFSGVKYEVDQDGEVVGTLPDWEFTLYLLTEGTTEYATTVTNESGEYRFAVLASELEALDVNPETVDETNFEVRETLPEDWEEFDRTGTAWFCIEEDAGPRAFVEVRTDEPENIYTCNFYNRQTVEEDPVPRPEFPSQCLLPQNLIGNGDFEEPVVTNTSGYQFFSNPLGWIVTTVQDGLSASLEFHRNWSGNQAFSGEQYVELDANEAVQIAQTVAVEEGAEYELFWAFAPRQDRPADDNLLSVLLNGTEVATQGPVAGGSEALAVEDWATSSVTFTATGDTVEVAFAQAGTDNSYGTFLDNLILCKTAEAPGVEPDPDPTPTSSGARSGPVLRSQPVQQVAGETTTVEDVVEEEVEETDVPDGLVLGEQVSVVPVGGAATGAGGTAPAHNHTSAFNTLAVQWLLARVARVQR